MKTVEENNQLIDVIDGERLVKKYAERMFGQQGGAINKRGDGSME